MEESAESLIHRLAVSGPETDEGTVRAIIARKDETLPHLIQMAAQERYWDRESEFSAWAPICAMHILSSIRGKEALAAVEKGVREHYDDTGDWITEDMPHMLAAFGPEGLDVLESMVGDVQLDEWVRDGAARALVMIAKNHPESKWRSVDVLKQAISTENQESARTVLVDTLAEFKDPNMLSFIEGLFERDLIDTRLINYHTVLDIYAGEFDDPRHDTMRNPLDIFKLGAGNFYWNNNFPSGSTHRKVNKPKIGRNDPCPCGSGKKFKKCCLKMA